MKRGKSSSFVVSVKGAKGKCTFFEKVQKGDGWNILQARPGMNGKQKQFSNMNGWGLAVLGWCKGGDCELGEDKSYLVLHKNAKKHSIFTSRIFAAPANVTLALTSNVTVNDTDDENDTADANATDNATAPAAGALLPVAAPATAPAPAATPAAGGAAASGNATNGTNASNKTNATKKPKKKKLPEPKAGDNSDDEAEGKDLSYDIDEDEDFEGLDMREKIDKATNWYILDAGFIHVKWLKWLHLFNDDDE